MDIVVVDKVRKQYQNYVALNDVSFSIEEGSIFGLLGPNGAGKTTFIRTLTQITSPDSGTIYFCGEKLNRSHISKIGYLPEERGLYKKMKVGEQALYLARLKGLDSKTAMEELKKWFIKFEITSWWDKKVEELSKGMAQKIQFITTVIHKPQVLIFDEPFSGFDPVNVNILKQEILQLQQQGTTIIFSTHNMSSVEELCDSIVLIDHSEIVLKGKVKELKKQLGKAIYQFEIELFDDYNKDMVNDISKCAQDAKVENNIFSGNILIKEYYESVCRNGAVFSGDKAELTNMVLKNFMQLGNIVSFNEMLPTMNDIFIQTVTK